MSENTKEITELKARIDELEASDKKRQKELAKLKESLDDLWRYVKNIRS